MDAKIIVQKLQNERRNTMTDMFDILRGEIEEDVYEPANPTLHLLEIPDGGEFAVGNMRFVKLGFEQGGILAILKEAPFRLEFNGGGDNNYCNSTIRTKLNTEFLPRLEAEQVELLPYTMNLRAENGQTDYGSCTETVGLLTTDLYRKYYYQIPKLEVSEWLATPFSCLRDYPYVMYVNSSGDVSNYVAHSAYRCRPACIFAI